MMKNMGFREGDVEVVKTKGMILGESFQRSLRNHLASLYQHESEFRDQEPSQKEESSTLLRSDQEKKSSTLLPTNPREIAQPSPEPTEKRKAQTSTELTYRCSQSDVGDGNRVMMPASALEHLLSSGFQFPMLFEIKNPRSGRVSHCGVQEFTAEEGFVCLPSSMMKNMQLLEGDLVNLINTHLPKGTQMKIQPHTTKFIDQTNLKDLLEETLKKFSCATTGDTIMITHSQEDYYLDILETKPLNAISLTDTDCEVDFAPPLDYKEPEMKPKAVMSKPHKAQEGTEKEEPRFKPFTGASWQLDGQQLTSTMGNKKSTAAVKRENIAAASPSNSRKYSGKVVFGTKDATEPLKVSEGDVKDKRRRLRRKNFSHSRGRSTYWEADLLYNFD
ncbi:hypothetical protein RJ639_013317 [Escallonia herrerae]|uniref:Uncharacterized protein n=1 Tax=Escallonia herrerae TaxID=1293975 RepID=A0AA88VG07_9ASTE|nr:hypothetical protein RJ639_013317 [Escallonia herrerae]